VSRVLVSVVLSSFVAPLSTSALGVSLPLVARDLEGASVDSVEALVALTLAVAMFVLPLGRAADLLGHVMVFRMGLLLAVAGFALASLSPNFLLLCGALAVGGVGLATVFGSNNALLFQVVASDRRGSAVGVNSILCVSGAPHRAVSGRFLGPGQLEGRVSTCLGASFGVGCSGWRPFPSRGGADRVLIG